MNPLLNVRKHHAIEHACINIAHARFPSLPLAGYSDLQGFWILGDIETDRLMAAVDEALSRLRAGEHRLAIHPNCGTNFAAAGLVAGTLAWLGMLGTDKSFRKQIDRWPLVISLVTLGLIAAQPLGPFIQANYTTDPNVGNLKVKEIIISKRGAIKVHRFKMG